jgi:sugar phosphate isomerase/epimerase
MRQALTSGEMTLFDFIDWCAELEIPGTELTSYYFEENFDGAYLQALKRRVLANGLTTSGTAVANNFCLPSGDEKDTNIKHVLSWIDFAADLFAPHIRIFAGDLPEGTSKETGIQWVADGIKAVLDHAEKRGVLIGLENHGGITARVADQLAICDAVGQHDWFGINLDTGNFRVDAYEELAIAAPLAVNVQVKVEVTKNDGTRAHTDFERLRDILVAANYKGWVALEYEAREDPRTAIPRYLGELKALFG